MKLLTCDCGGKRLLLRQEQNARVFVCGDCHKVSFQRRKNSDLTLPLGVQNLWRWYVAIEFDLLPSSGEVVE